jgi:hypothetical protein
MSTRKLETTSRAHSTIAFYSKKNGCMQYAESHFEAEVLIDLELDNSVESYSTQPVSITYLFNGTWRRYTPDVLVKYKSGRFVFFEIKPLKHASTPAFLDKFAALQIHFRESIGHELILITEKHIRVGKSAANRRLLYRHLTAPLPKKESDKIIGMANGIHPLTVRDLERLCSARKHAKQHAWSMIASGLFTYSNRQLLTRDSKLKIAA